jgi:serine/threonine protein kinase
MDRLLHYEIAERLGEGKNGTTYLAMDTGLQRAVVIKLLEHPSTLSED